MSEPNSLFGFENWRRQVFERCYTEGWFHWKIPSTPSILKDQISSDLPRVHSKLSELGIVLRAEIPVPLKPRGKAPSTGHWPWSLVWNNRFQRTGWNAQWLLALGHRQGGSTPVAEHRQNLFVLLCKTWVTHSISCLEKQFRRYY